ncbi:MAG: ABC transporter permease [Candidatus Heimdallarchaeota archaeon]|nr:ABC transporter permease [Candidatus Heimdallarchaeota archaeon]
MKKLLQLTTNYIKHYTRNRSILIGAIVFPLVFVAVFGIAFQYSEPGTTTIRIGILSTDQGIPSNAIVPFDNSNATAFEVRDYFYDILTDITFEDNETKIFDISYYNADNESTALADLEKREIYILLYLDNDFSLGFMAALRNQLQIIPGMDIYTNNWVGYPNANYTTDMVMKGDQTLQSFSIASSVLLSVVNTFFNLGDQLNGVNIDVEGAYETESFTAFDMVLPGIVMFALLITMQVVAQSSLKDVESGLIERLKISKISDWEYTLSLILGQLVISIIQIPILFGVGLMFGFPFNSSIGIAFLFAVLISLSVSGIGLMIAGIVKNQEAAGTAGNMIATPMAFLSSAFFMVPNPELFSIGDIAFRAFDILPSTLAIESLRLVMLSGYGLGDLVYQLVFLSVLAVLYLGLGMFLYSKKHLRAN